jgi:hypothetical protein
VANLWLWCRLTCGDERTSGIAPFGDAVATVAIGSARALSIEYSHEIIDRAGPRSWRTLASLGALVLSVFVLAFAGEEAQAQQQHAVTEGWPTETDVTLSTEASPTEEASARDERLAKTSQVEPELSVGLTPPNPEAASRPALHPGPVSRPMPGSDEEQGSVGPVDPVLTAPASEAVTGPTSPGLSRDDAELKPALETNSVPPDEPVPGSVDPDPSALVLEPPPETGAAEEIPPLSLLDEEAPVAEPAVPTPGEAGDLYTLSGLGTSMADAAETTLEGTIESAVENALEGLVGGALSWAAGEKGEGLVDTPLASLFSGGEARHTPVSGPAQKPEPSSTGSESPLRDAPSQPVSPFTPPPVGSYFSLSGSQVGPGGVVLLLLCVLTTGLILLRRDFKLLWDFCELPKPNSALRRPLERPG